MKDKLGGLLALALRWLDESPANRRRAYRAAALLASLLATYRVVDGEHLDAVLYVVAAVLGVAHRHVPADQGPPQHRPAPRRPRRPAPRATRRTGGAARGGRR